MKIQLFKQISTAIRSIGLACMLAITALHTTAGVSWAASWEGVDKTVIEKIAAQNGQPVAKPLIDIGQGDILLFVFLVAGVISGFVLGYFWRALFVDSRVSRKQREIYVANIRQAYEDAAKIHIKTEEPSAAKKPRLHLVHQEKDTDGKG
ncbi:MAG TPA: hypothetical protein VGK02_00215 [Candidatus Aquicultor sp.]|jgi:ABC-type cobalt transport system substrate-binding protein